MKKSFLVISAILSSFLILPAFAGDNISIKNKDKTEAKFYGYIQMIPKGKIGIWKVKNNIIVVDKETEIKEKHGKVKVGAYVEVKANISKKDFIATEIEVKKSKEENEKGDE